MKWWRQNAKRFMNLQVRERKLIFYSTQVVIIWLAGVLLIEPLIQQTSGLSKQNHDTEQQIQRIQQQSAIIQRALNVDLNEQVRTQITEQQQIEQELVQKIQQMTGSYISANQMLGLLEDLLVKQKQQRSHYCISIELVWYFMVISHHCKSCSGNYSNFLGNCIGSNSIIKF